jgi:chromosomal replication initiator protein
MQAWEDFLQVQERILGSEITDKWLRSLKIKNFDACNLYLEADDAFQIAWFEEHVRPNLRMALCNNNNHPIKVHLSVNGDNPAARKKSKKVPLKPQSERSPYASDATDPLAQFKYFQASGSSQIALKLLSELASENTEKAPLSQAAFNPIYLYGGGGVGKTHLLMAAANALSQTGLKVFYVRADTFTEHVVTAIRNGSMQDFRSTYRHVDVLIVDDIHHFARKNATQEEFFHTFNALHTSGRQIILSANTPPSLLQEIEPRLISRFEWGISLHLEKMETEQLLNFVNQRCELLQFDLQPDVIDYLIKTFAPNTKSIQKSIDTLILRSHLDLGSKQLSLDTARHFLGKLIEEHEKIAITPSKIVQAVADFYGVTIDDILGKSQSQDCVIPRQMAMFVCRKELKLPYIKIGQFFLRDHSTVMSSVKMIEKKTEDQDKETCSAVSGILRRIET